MHIGSPDTQLKNHDVETYACRVAAKNKMLPPISIATGLGYLYLAKVSEPIPIFESHG